MNDEHVPTIGARLPQREARLGRVFWIMLSIVTCLAAILGVESVYNEAAEGCGFDFYQFWLGGDVVRAHQVGGRRGVLDLYTDDAHVKIGEQYLKLAATRSRRQQEAAAKRSVVDTASSPFFYWVFSIAMPGDYDREYRRYIVFSLACMVGTIIALAWRLRYSVAGIGTALALISISAPVSSDFNVINFNFPELTICCVYLFLRGQARQRPAIAALCLLSAGVVMGLLAAFKPNLLLVPALLGVSGLVSGRWRNVLAETGGFVIAAAGAVAVSSWAFGGISCWAAWGQIVLDLGSRPRMPSGYGNFSPTRNIYEATGMNLISLFTAMGLLLAIGAIWLGRRRSDTAARSIPAGGAGAYDRELEFRHDLAIFGIAVAVTLLSSGLAWVHYPILLFPFLLLAASRGRPGRIRISADVARYLMLSIAVALLLFPPLEIRRALPFLFDSYINLHRIQAAVGITLVLALWFEARLLNLQTPGLQYPWTPMKMGGFPKSSQAPR